MLVKPVGTSLSTETWRSGPTKEYGMEQDIKPDLKTIESAKASLLKVVDRGVSLANRNTNHVRNLAFLGVLATLWLALYVHHSFSLSLYTVLPVYLILLLPVLFLIKLFFTLRDIQELPARLDQCFSGFKFALDEYHEQFKTRLNDAKQKRNLSDLFSFGRDLRQVMRVARDTDGLASAVGGAIVLGNPLFLIAILIASTVTVLLIIIAAATLLISIF